jgi:hypothetical protein
MNATWSDAWLIMVISTMRSSVGSAAGANGSVSASAIGLSRFAAVGHVEDAWRRWVRGEFELAS